mgnify:CR=1 FL=1
MGNEDTEDNRLKYIFIYKPIKIIRCIYHTLRRDITVPLDLIHICYVFLQISQYYVTNSLPCFFFSVWKHFYNVVFEYQLPIDKNYQEYNINSTNFYNGGFSGYTTQIRLLEIDCLFFSIFYYLSVLVTFLF